MLTMLLNGRSRRHFLLFIATWATCFHQAKANIFGVLDIQSLPSDIQGFDIYGNEAGGQFGFAVGGGASCDVNGDTYDDIMIGATFEYDSKGVTYVLYGHSAGTPFSTIIPSLVSGSTGFKIVGDLDGGNTGFSCACAGDVNGDGIEDILIGGPFAKLQAGVAYIVFGVSGIRGDVDLGTMLVPVGITISGANSADNLGYAVDRAGDVNNDGNDDVIISAPAALANGGAGAGIVYVLFGDPSITDIDLSSFVSGSSGFRILGATAGGNCGLSVSGAGDVNSDGFSDLIIGCPFENGLGRTFAGAAYVLFGNSTYAADANLLSFDTTLGWKIVGQELSNLGVSVSRAGDVNHDGVADFIVGAVGVDHAGRSDTGAGYVLFGLRAPQPLLQLVDVTTYDFGTSGFDIYGTSSSRLGYGVTTVGDFNGDGIDDVAISAFSQAVSGRGNPGSAYVIFGHTNATVFDTLDFSLLSYGSWGFQLVGASNLGGFGASLRSAGDFNQDGRMDLLVGAMEQSGNGLVSNGAAYVIFGNVGWAVPTTAPSLAVNANNKVQLLQDMATFASGNTGIKISGFFDNDQLGTGMNSGILCDLNNDGFHDLIVCSPHANEGTGATYVIYGQDGSTHTFGDINFVFNPLGEASVGFQVNGADIGDGSGASCACAGDVNGDGIADLLIGAPNRVVDGAANAGTVYVLYGKNGNREDIDLSSFTTSSENGFLVFANEVNTFLGISVDGAGDVNNDGYDDIIIGAPAGAAGSALVLFGRPLTANMDVSSAAISLGVRIMGTDPSGACGYYVSGAGDTNGDHYDDFLIGCPGSAGKNGTAYLIMGKATFPSLWFVTSVNGANGVRITGTSESSLGVVSRAGDINSDGLDDVIVGAPQFQRSGSVASSGAAVVVWGQTDAPYATISLESLLTMSSNHAFAIFGSIDTPTLGASVGCAGDYNGDGIDDFIVGAPRGVNPKVGRGGPASTGLAYVFLGHEGSFDNIQLSDFHSGAMGFLLLGKAVNDSFGIQAHGVGDFNHDGLMDIAISATTGSANGLNDNGRVYVSFGRVGVEPFPTTAPTMSPSHAPAVPPTPTPTVTPTANPSTAPTLDPTAGPTYQPTNPTPNPTFVPTASPVLERSTADIPLSIYAGGAEPSGRAYVGSSADVNLGNALGGGGDFNGDGIVDVIVGQYAADINGGNTGAAFVVFGGAAGGSIDFSGFSSGYLGFRILGSDFNSNLGFAVAFVGNFNGDSYADVIVSAHRQPYLGRPEAGAAFILFGHSGPFSDVHISGFSSATGTGWKLYGAAQNDYFGYSVAGIGDFNSDGLADVAIGAYKTDRTYGTDTGTVYVILGRVNIGGDLDCSSFTTSNSNGFRINGAVPMEWLGYSVSGAGDINADGFQDLIIGAPNSNLGGSSAGAAYVVYGKSSGFVDMEMNGFASSTLGFRIVGTTSYQLGFSVAGLGDVNGDGIADVVVGAPISSLNRFQGGTCYIIFGKSYTTGNLQDILVWVLPTNWQGYRITGEVANDKLGNAVTKIGDINGDGISDVLLGASESNRNGFFKAGVTYVIFGGVRPAVDIDLSTTFPGYRLIGAGQNDVSGVALSGVGDFNQDGMRDFVIGAMGATVGGLSNRGRVYIIYGMRNNPTSQPSSQPSRQPTLQPSSQPSRLPSSQPSAQPSRQPSNQPTRRPSSQPSGQPSIQPSKQPSGQPSRQPSRQPTEQPSQQPSRQPSAQPSGLPSSQPSLQPSSQPSGQPSGQPSCQPSTQPSVQPSFTPSMQPSAQPSGQPTSQPSGQPSGQPSSRPSIQPSVVPSGQPSLQPSVQPSIEPTSQPSTQPSVQPSREPSAQPSGLPTGQPSNGPSVQPSAAPTGQPSNQPSAGPSAQPTSQPSVQPSEQPSMQPSTQPTAQPSNQPSCQPTQQPSGQPSFQPSSQPTEQPSGQPTSQPSCQPTAQPSSAPSKQPSSQPSRQPTSQPTRTPSGQPSSQPSSQPTSQPSRRPSTQPSIQPTSQPSTSPTAWYNATLELISPPAAPLITSIKVNHVERTAVALTIFNEGRRNVMIYCAAFASLTYQPRSTFEILSQNTLVNSKNGFAYLTVKNLYAATDYSIYCMSVTPRGVQLSLANALSQVAHVRTVCCKLITVSLLTSSVFERKSIGDAVSIAINGPPSSTLSVNAAFVSTSGTSVIVTSSVDAVPTYAYPSSVTWNPSGNFQAVQFLRLVAGTEDTVVLVVTLSGASAEEYVLEYTENRRVVNILSMIVEPTLPVLAVARFSDDGSAVALTFDSPTDKARYSNVFSCMSLLSFDGADTAACQWMSSATVLLYPKYTGPDSNALAVGSNVTLFADQVRARCVVNDTSACSAWATVPLTRVAVRAPVNPTTPVVSFPLPSAVSACNPLVIDLTASSGTAGRPWESLTFKVLTSNGETVAAMLLQQYLDANYTYSPPTVVPTDILAPGFIYSIQATLCNFLGACGTVVRKVTVHQGAVLVPIASINGPKQRDTYRYAPLVLNSAAYTKSCDDIVAYGNLTHTWTVLAVAANGSTSGTSVKSSSQDSAVFKLAPYALTVGAMYEVVLTVTSTISGVSSSTSTIVTVLPGGLVARIAQGTAALVQAGTTVSLDASGSYDQDVALLTGWDAGLSFQWSCEQLEPIFNPDCSNSVASDLSEHGDINTVAVKSDAALNSVLLFTVRVSTADASRSSRAFIEVTTTAAVQSDLRITNTASSITSVDAGSALTLRGLIKVSAPCIAMWTVDDSFVNLVAVARTSIAKSILPSSGLPMAPFNLVVAEGALAQRATFAFSLQCGESSSTVTVTTNGAPLPGVFTVSPSTGVELSTLFTFTAVQWSDPDLPLTYQFSYAVPGGASSFALGSATEKSYTESSLPAGALNCTMAVYDSFSASAVEVQNITVTSIGLEDRSAALSALLRSTTGSVDDTKRVLSVASATLSQSNCSTVDLNCTAFSANDREFRSTLLETLESLTAREDVNKLSVQDWSATLQSLTTKSLELAEIDINRMIYIANRTILSARTVKSTNYNGLVGVLQAVDAAVSSQKLLNATGIVNINATESSATNVVVASTNNSAAMLVSIASTFADVVTNAQVFGENITEFLYDNFRMSAGLYELSADAASLTLQSPQSEADRLLGMQVSTATLAPAANKTGAESIVAVKVIDVQPQAYPIDPTAFLSNPLYLQVTAQNGQSPLDMVSELDFTFQHLGSVTEFDTRYDVNFTFTCLGLSWTESYAFVCPGSGVVLNNSCSNGLGEYTLFCPKLTPSCAQLGVYSAEVDILNTCNVTDFSSTHTTCRCSLSAATDTQARRPLSFRRRLAATVENQAMDETGVTSMMATSHYVLMEFADTFNAADKFNDPAMVVIVIYMFATVWGVGLLILSVCLTKGYISKREKMKQMSNKVAVATATLQGSSSSASDVAQAKRVLLDYIDGVFPSVYDDTKSSFGRMLGELRAHHRYMTVFTLNDGQISLKGKMLVIGKILTVETMQMFVLAMLYDLQGPENDNSCGQFANEEACHTRKSLFDSAQSYCEWNNQPSPGQDNCMYREEQFSFKISMYILVLTSIFSSLFATPLDYLFKVCHAPLLENATQAQVSNRVGGRSSLARGVRRLSAISANAVKAARRTTIAATVEVRNNMKRIKGWFTPAKQSELVIANREISEDVEHLHLQALTILPSVSVNSDTLLRQKQAAALHMKSRAFSKRGSVIIESESDQSLQTNSDKDQGELRAASSAKMSTSSKTKESPKARAAVLELCEEIIAQRELMPKDSPYTTEFDAQWGIRTITRPAAGFRSGSAVGSYHVTYVISEEARADIYDAIVTSDEQAAELNESMPRYTLQHGGLAVLNLFVLDLLGRTTSAAKIYRNKFEEDFEKTKPVSRWFKALAVAIILGANGFFIFYSLLKAFQKGTTWQYKYLQGCIVQFVVELFLNETIECIWLNFVVPDLVRKDVKKATVVINKVVEQITESAQARSGRSILFLDATPYLFSSTKVARAHPSLLESIVVLNYQSHVPGELSKTWPRCIQVATESQRYVDGLANEGKSMWERVCSALPVAILTISTFLVLTLQGLGTMSFRVQRVVIRLIQPTLLSGLTLMWFFASQSTAGLVIVTVGCSFIFAAFIWRQYYVHKLERAQNNSTAPGFDDTALFIDLDGEMEDIESVPNSPKKSFSSENNLLSLHKVSSDGNLKSAAIPTVSQKQRQLAIFHDTSSDESVHTQDHAFDTQRDVSAAVNGDNHAPVLSSGQSKPQASTLRRRLRSGGSDDFTEDSKRFHASEESSKRRHAQESKEFEQGMYEVALPAQDEIDAFAQELSMKHSFSFAGSDFSDGNDQNHELDVIGWSPLSTMAASVKTGAPEGSKRVLSYFDSDSSDGEAFAAPSSNKPSNSAGIQTFLRPPSTGKTLMSANESVGVRGNNADPLNSVKRSQRALSLFDSEEED